MPKTGDDRAMGLREHSDGNLEASRDPYLLARMLSSLVTRLDSLEARTTRGFAELQGRCDDEEISVGERFGSVVQMLKGFEDRIESLSILANASDSRAKLIGILESELVRLKDQVRALSEEVSRLKPASPEPPAAKPLADDDLVNLDGWLGREERKHLCVDEDDGSGYPSGPTMQEWLQIAATIKGISPVKSSGGTLYPVHLYRTVAKYLGTGKSAKLGRDGLIKYLVMADGMQKACNGKA